MKPGLELLAGLWLLGSVCACQGLSSSGNSDLKSGKDGAALPDLSSGGSQADAGPTLAKCMLTSGCVGAPCAMDTDCKEAKTPVCFQTQFLNNPNDVDTPQGYCSGTCTTNADCGTGHCYKPAGSATSYCMAQCNNATTCRHPGYACTYEGTTAICFPDANLNCQPSVGTCSVKVETGVIAPGGCIPAAYEDVGVCHPGCVVGTNTCGKSPANNSPQHCIEINTTIDNTGAITPSKWNGPVCWDLETTPTAAGQPCTYLDECADGYECDRLNVPATNRVCRRLCAQGNGVQDPGMTVYRPTNAMPFGSSCPTPGQCLNVLTAGTGNGQPGLCE